MEILFAAVLCQKTTLKWGNPAGPVSRCFRCWGQILRILETLHTRPTHGFPAGLCSIDAGMLMMWGRSSGGEWMRDCGVRPGAPRIRSEAVTSNSVKLGQASSARVRPGREAPDPVPRESAAKQRPRSSKQVRSTGRAWLAARGSMARGPDEELSPSPANPRRKIGRASCRERV